MYFVTRMETRRQTMLNEKKFKEQQTGKQNNTQNECAEPYACCGCNRTFSTQAGCKRHMRYCALADGVLLVVDKSNMNNYIAPENKLRGSQTAENSQADNSLEAQNDGILQQQMKGSVLQKIFNMAEEHTTEVVTRMGTRRQTMLNEDKNREEQNEQQNNTENDISEPFACCGCNRTFTTHAGCKRHMRYCAAADGSSSVVDRRNIDNSSGPDNSLGESQILDESEVDNPPELQDSGSLQQQMKGITLNKVNGLVDETSALDPGKCHCCGEDLDTAHSGGDFECVDCSKSFKLKSSLERHRRVIHMEGETYTCPECNARCPDKGTLARHMYTHTGLKPYSCLRCQKTFSRKYHLERHILQTGCDGKSRSSFPCQVCGRMFSRKDNLRQHLRAHAGQVIRKKTYTCEHCHKEFQGATLLQVHLRTHTGERPYACDLCPKRFPSSGAMKKHRRMHTGERPYECKECYAKFAARETLNRHIRTHTGIRPHICQFCGKSFIQSAQLRAHIFHHTGENGFTCVHCSKAFNRRSRLLMHVKYVHEGAKPYECEQCPKTFVRKEDLARHTILHSGIKAHKCPICQKNFAMKSSLKIHLLTHTKEPPRSCDECGRAFIRQDCLLRHMRTKHRDMLEEILAETEKKKLQQQLLAAAASQGTGGPGVGLNGSGSDGGSDGSGIIPSLSEAALADSVRELLALLVDEATLKAFGWPETQVDQLLEAVIRRCGHQPVTSEELLYPDRLRENAKLLFTVVIDDSAVKTLLNNQTVDEVILHVLRLAKS